MAQYRRGVRWFWQRSFSPIWGFVIGLITATISWPGFLLETVGFHGLFSRRTFESFDLWLGDRLQMRSPRARPVSSSPIIVLGIDQKSIERFGPMPWKRGIYAHMIRQLKRAGARVIALDIYFEEASRDPGEDRDLIAACREAGNVILPVYAEIPTVRTALVPDAQGVYRKPLRGRYKPIYDAAAGIGHLNVYYDADHVVRRVPALVGPENSSERFAPLSLAAVLRYHGKPISDLHIMGNHLVAGEHLLPLDELHCLLINYLNYEFNQDASLEKIRLAEDAGDIPWMNAIRAEKLYFFSCRDVLEEKIPSWVFRDAIVVVGWTVPGEWKLEDVHLTPHGPRFGVFVQTQLLHTIFSRLLLKPVPTGLMALCLIGVSVILGGILFRVRFPTSVYVSVFSGVFILVLLIGGVIVGGLWLRQAGWAADLFPFMVVATLNLGGAITANTVRTGRELEQHDLAMETIESVSARSTLALDQDATFSHPLGEVGDPGRITISSSIAAQSPELVLDGVGQAVRAEGYSLHLFQDKKRGEPPAEPFERKLYRGFAGVLTPHHADAVVKVILPRLCAEKSPILQADWRHMPEFSHIGRHLREVLCVPLLMRGDMLGILSLFNKIPSPFSPERRFTEHDIRIINTLSHQAAVILENARQYRLEYEMFMGFVRSLAVAVDLRDKYTHGHSERVAKFSVAIAKEIGLNRQQQEIVEEAALLHDLGKIGVRDDVLNKPGALTEYEKMQIQLHTVKGYEVLKETPRFESLLSGARHHHEKYDGTGYPDGLKGREIPLLARIIAVADTYDAMTSDRVYRKGLSKEEACLRLREGAGTQFDPAILEAFFRVLAREEDVENIPDSERV